eukprot:snap_masked-scaffold_1-processed-gene-6.29-mRNA-1 protein AED:1.00 eAED:1.00 QI:0/-1/0/0/-1/1/1/0/59
MTAQAGFLGLVFLLGIQILLLIRFAEAIEQTENFIANICDEKETNFPSSYKISKLLRVN